MAQGQSICLHTVSFHSCAVWRCIDAEELRPNEKLLAFLDDLYVVCAPDRVATIYALLQNKLWQHARIRVNLGRHNCGIVSSP